MNGDVQLQIEGLMLEKLIMRALHEGAVFRRLARKGPRILIAETDPDSAAILTGLCEKFSIPCRLLTRRGKDAMVKRLKSRATLLAGMLTCMICMSLFFSRIWMVDIILTGEGNSDALRKALAALNVRPGMAADALDAALLEEQLAAASPDYSFIGIRRQGVRLLVEASSAVAAPELYNLSDSGDLVAACDGVVLSVNVLSGKACVRPGETVIRGQTLIQGTERVSKETNRDISALGTVIARTWHEGTASLNRRRTITVPTGRSSTSAALQLFSRSWPLTEGESYSSQDCLTEVLPIGGLFLPLEIRRTTAYETETRSIEIDEQTLREALARLACAAAGIQLNRSHPESCDIADRWIEYTQDANGLVTARAVYEIHTDIAVPRDASDQQGGYHIGNH